METNSLGQPVGRPVPGWGPRPMPTAPVLVGRYCRLERLSEDDHAEELFAADRQDLDGASWTYLPYGPFGDLFSYREWVRQCSGTADPRFYAIVDTDSAVERAVGVASYLRIQPEAGSIEVGHVHYSPALAASSGRHRGPVPDDAPRLR